MCIMQIAPLRVPPGGPGLTDGNPLPSAGATKTTIPPAQPLQESPEASRAVMSTPPFSAMSTMESSPPLVIPCSRACSREAFASCSSARSSGPSGIETAVSRVLPQSLLGMSSSSSLPPPFRSAVLPPMIRPPLTLSLRRRVATALTLPRAACVVWSTCLLESRARPPSTSTPVKLFARLLFRGASAKAGTPAFSEGPVEL